MKKRGSFDGRGAPSSRRLFLVSFSPRGARAMPFHECNSREAREGRAREQIRRRMFGDFFFSLDFQIDLRLSQFRQKTLLAPSTDRGKFRSPSLDLPSLRFSSLSLSLSPHPPTHAQTSSRSRTSTSSPPEPSTASSPTSSTPRRSPSSRGGLSPDLRREPAAPRGAASARATCRTFPTGARCSASSRSKRALVAAALVPGAAMRATAGPEERLRLLLLLSS